MKLKTILVSAVFIALTGTAFAANGTNSTAAAQTKTIAHCRIFADVNRSFITHLIPFVSSKSQKEIEFTMIVVNSKSLSENLAANQNIVNAAESQLVSELQNDRKDVKNFGIVCDNPHS